MKKDISEQSFREVEEAAHRIMDAYGRTPIDSSSEKYENGDLVIIRHLETIIIRYKGHEVMHTYVPGEGKEVSTFYPDDWIDELERIDNSISS